MKRPVSLRAVAVAVLTFGLCLAAYRMWKAWFLDAEAPTLAMPGRLHLKRSDGARSAPGEPIGVMEFEARQASAAYNNENLRNFLAQERDKLGAAEVPALWQAVAQENINGPGSSRRVAPPSSEYLRAREQTRSMMREMARDIERSLRGRNPPPVVLKGGKPVLLSEPEQTREFGSPIEKTSPARDQ